MQGPDEGLERGSPWLQAGRLGFKALYVVTLLAALIWAFSNIREVDPENQAVVFRMGAMNRVQDAGLLLAWPRPFEQVVMIPSPDRILQWRVRGLLRNSSWPSMPEGDYSPYSNDAVAGSGYLLTGDAGIVQLDVNISYKVVDPYDYVLESDHIVPALDRLAKRSAIVLSSGRDLDSILVARPDLIGTDNAAGERREQLRAELVEDINRSLAALKLRGAGLGIKVERVDIQSSLPGAAIEAFNSVLTASQQAEQAIAAARTDAAKDLQAATQTANQIIQSAHASADERLATAKANTATIASLTGTAGNRMDPGLPQRLYRDRMSAILSQAGSVTSVDPTAGSRLILQGADK
jgi:regulator of protease activity HflC (stomatin/prohibitin superfamily)